MLDIKWYRNDQDDAWMTEAVYLLTDQEASRGTDASYHVVTIFDGPADGPHDMEITFIDPVYNGEMPSLVYRVEAASMDVAVAMALVYIGRAMLYNLDGARHINPSNQ